MNLSVAVVGASGAGKTLFCINFAEYLGAHSLSYTEAGKASGRRRALLSPAAARRLMVEHGRRSNGVVRTLLSIYRRSAPASRFDRYRCAEREEPAARPERSG